MDAENKCPVMHGAITKNMGEGRSNREWWPNQLNLNILRQHSRLSNPMDKNFNYSDEFKKIDLKKLKREIYDLMGIYFDNHPNMKRLLLWENFDGHPLRKDFVN